MGLGVGADAGQLQVVPREVEGKGRPVEAQVGDAEALVLLAPGRRGQRQLDAQVAGHLADGRLDHAQDRGQHGVDDEAAHGAQVGALGRLHRHALGVSMQVHAIASLRVVP